MISTNSCYRTGPQRHRSHGILRTRCHVHLHRWNGLHGLHYVLGNPEHRDQGVGYEEREAAAAERKLCPGKPGHIIVVLIRLY